MKGIWKWLAPFSLFVLLLSVPMVTGAALYSGPWDPTSPVYGTQGTYDGREINDAYHGTDSLGNHYFKMNLMGAPSAGTSSGNRYAESYRIYIDLTPDGSRSSYDYRFELNADDIGSVLSYSVAYQRSGSSSEPNLVLANLSTSPANSATGLFQTLEWKYAGAIGTTLFEWWGETRYNNSTEDYTNSALTPIPGAAWLLGSGLVGLIGLKRRSARKA